MAGSAWRFWLRDCGLPGAASGARDLHLPLPLEAGKDGMLSVPKTVKAFQQLDLEGTPKHSFPAAERSEDAWKHTSQQLGDLKTWNILLSSLEMSWVVSVGVEGNLGLLIGLLPSYIILIPAGGALLTGLLV